MPIQTLIGLPEDAYFETRYAVLREPLGMPRGSERLSDDVSAVHAWSEVEGSIVAVGRAHMILDSSDGSGSDHDGPNAAKIPAFGPLVSGLAKRPAFQIRQMGTLPTHQREGHAAKVLMALELTLVEQHGACTGVLQAREHAVPFYQSQGWSIIDEPYSITGIGPHRSMIKEF